MTFDPLCPPPPSDLPLRQVVGEECVAFMLNWRENDYLTLQVPPPLVQSNPYIKVSPPSPSTPLPPSSLPPSLSLLARLLRTLF